MNNDADRLPPLSAAQWTEPQRQAAQEVLDGPRGALIAPFVPMLRSPELMTHAQRMGEYLRYRSALTLRLSELAILMTARHWSQQVEWAIHAPIALRAGVAAATIAAIAAGQAPQGLPEDEATVYAFGSELQCQQQVSEAIWQQAVRLFGEQGVVDLIGIHGYYTFLAMLMNAARTALPAATASPLPPLPPLSKP